MLESELQTSHKQPHSVWTLDSLGFLTFPSLSRRLSLGKNGRKRAWASLKSYVLPCKDLTRG